MSIGTPTCRSKGKPFLPGSGNFPRGGIRCGMNHYPHAQDIKSTMRIVAEIWQHTAQCDAAVAASREMIREHRRSLLEDLQSERGGVPHTGERGHLGVEKSKGGTH